MTGVTQRSISSIAVGEQRRIGREGAPARSGCSNSASIPPVMRLRVVSLPAFIRSMKKKSTSSWREALTVDLSAQEQLRRSSPGASSRCCGELVGVGEHLAPPRRAASASVIPSSGSPMLIIASVQREHLVTVLVRDADELGDHLERHLDRHVGDEVERAALGDCVEQRPARSRGCAARATLIWRGVKPRLTSLRSLRVPGRVEVDQQLVVGDGLVPGRWMKTRWRRTEGRRMP